MSRFDPNFGLLFNGNKTPRPKIEPSYNKQITIKAQSIDLRLGYGDIVRANSCLLISL